jgi:LemA protein
MAQSKKLPTGWIVGGVIVLLLLIIGFWIGGTYNSLVVLDENANAKWANVQADYQRRADLIPNLVSTVKAYTNYEGPLLLEITNARSAWASAGSETEQQAAARGMDSALSRLLVVMENYPTLQASEQFLSLQDELAGTENRIKVSRVEYNEAIRAYNQRTRTFPSNIIAGMFGFGQREMFEAAEGTDVVPSVGDAFATP